MSRPLVGHQMGKRLLLEGKKVEFVSGIVKELSLQHLLDINNG